ncbi:MAG: hypothetical protein RL095_2157 [Verrucomicrobiota bacterium]|jgi:hypothetical protein
MNTEPDTAKFFANFNCPGCGRDHQALQLKASRFGFDPAQAEAHAVREVVERQARRCGKCSRHLALMKLVPHGVFPAKSMGERVGA